MWLENVIAIPKDNFDIDGGTTKYLQPERTDRSGDFARECGQDHFRISPSAQGTYMHIK